MGALYALTVDSMITEIFVILYTFVPVIGRSLYDIQNGLYALSSFFVAKWIVFMCYAVFDVLLFAIPYYFLAGLDTDPVIFFKMLGTLFYASICFAGLDYPKERDILFERLGLKIDNLPIDFAALGGFLVVALIIAYVGLFRRSKQMKG
ncbi:unnamed protein product [Notodromas monacha]|uniref:ABC-2 type transporter transmembrane domain-containing protein n=1 Tax=Notodromas monacha TaxID=399045 RepID=A0A7R9GF15_9CRUS|nr:unnamed protein product [Notodromas monacha]CAG0918862.1 unnamed protein product [Notodromas monacha]